MPICPHCGTYAPTGEFFCAECAKELDVDDETYPKGQDQAVFSGGTVTGFQEKTRFTADTILKIYIREVEHPITIENLKRVILGRMDTRTMLERSIDLTPYGALDKGVSRKHAALERQGDVLLLIDLNSTNGVLLNRQRIAADEPYVLEDGDEIRLNDLVMHVYFE